MGFCSTIMRRIYRHIAGWSMQQPESPMTTTMNDTCAQLNKPIQDILSAVASLSSSAASSSSTAVEECRQHAGPARAVEHDRALVLVMVIAILMITMALLLLLLDSRRRVNALYSAVDDRITNLIIKIIAEHRTDADKLAATVCKKLAGVGLGCVKDVEDAVNMVEEAKEDDEDDSDETPSSGDGADD
jgi:hypothetical protein